MATGSVRNPRTQSPGSGEDAQGAKGGKGGQPPPLSSLLGAAPPFSFLKVLGPQLGQIVGELMAAPMREVAAAHHAAGRAEARLEWIIDTHERDITRKVAEAVAVRDERIAELESALRGATDERLRHVDYIARLEDKAGRVARLEDDLTIAKAERDAIAHERDQALGKVNGSRPLQGEDLLAGDRIDPRLTLWQRLSGIDYEGAIRRVELGDVRDWTRSAAAEVQAWLDAGASIDAIPSALKPSVEHRPVE